MNKKYLLLYSAAAVAVVGGLVSFFALRGIMSDAYVRTIPYDATAIARLDARSFLHDADLSLKDVIRLLRQNQEGDDDQKIGIDMQRPIYAFTSPSGNIGVTAAVSDDDDLEAFCTSSQREGHASEITKQRGYSWVVLEQQWLLAFDSKKALVMGPAVGAGQDQLRVEMMRLLEQKSKDSGMESSLYAALIRDDEPLAAVVAPEILPSVARKELQRLKVGSKADALLRLTLETDDNELELEAEVLAEGEDVKAELKRLNDLLRPVKGTLTDYAHAENVAWLAVNVEGTTLLDALRSNNSVRMGLLALNFAFDLDRIIRAVDGDVALELTNVSSLLSGIGLDTPPGGFYVTAQVENTDFLNDAAAWGNNLFGVQALSQQDFALNLGVTSYYFGVQDKTFYLGATQGLAQEKNEFLSRERSDIRGNRLYATFAIPSLLNQLGSRTSLPPVLSRFERLNIEMERAGEFKLKLIAPRGTNIARELLLAE